MSLQVSRSVKGGLKPDSFHFILLGQSNPSTLGINKLVINKNDHLKLEIVLVIMASNESKLDVTVFAPNTLKA